MSIFIFCPDFTLHWHYFNINKWSQPVQIKLSHEIKTDIFFIILLYRENNTIFWSVERKENVKNNTQQSQLDCPTVSYSTKNNSELGNMLKIHHIDITMNFEADAPKWII